MELTRKGKIAHRLHERFHREMIKSTVNSLTDDEVRTLGKALNSMINFFKSQCSNDEY